MHGQENTTECRISVVCMCVEKCTKSIMHVHIKFQSRIHKTNHWQRVMRKGKDWPQSNKCIRTSHPLVEPRPCDKTEELLVTQFAMQVCGCSRKCSAQFSDLCLRYASSVLRSQSWWAWHGPPWTAYRFNTCQPQCNVVESRHLEKGRQKNYTTFHHAGKTVCGKTFHFLHTVGRKRMYHPGADPEPPIGGS